MFLATLAETSSPQLHAIGRISGWAIEPLLIYLILAFPSGRLTSRFDRRARAAAPCSSPCSFLPTALLVDRYPEPPVDLLPRRLPGNPFMVTGSEPALYRRPRAPAAGDHPDRCCSPS